MTNRVLLVFIALLLFAKAEAQQFKFGSDGMRIVERPESQTEVYHPERFNFHFQTTYIYQYKPAITSPYQGINSIDSNSEDANALTATLYFGLRLWKGADIYINPEMTAGSGLSGAHGMAGSSNGESFLVNKTSPDVYLARGYFRQTFSLRDKWARKNSRLNIVEHSTDQNQLAGYEPANYLRFYIGKLSLADLFDRNVFSNESRTQFMNWALMNNGAWDYASNPRGYTYSFVSELQFGEMNYKAAIATVPVTANSEVLATDLSKGYALNAEVTRTIKMRKRTGHIRLLGYLNSTMAATYDRAIVLANKYDVAPDITTADTSGMLSNKWGLGLSFDQELTDALGIFARAGYNDGLTQAWGFTEIDQTISLGLNLRGNAWKRDKDNLGLALVLNGLSEDHQRYLAMGGRGLVLGDGGLNYAPEFVTELYYSFRPVAQGIWFTGDYQLCVNPGYNSVRGPVNIFSFRLHVRL